MARLLFTTAFKPYGIDNMYSRRDSFPEVFHNRVTREQGVYSHRGHFSAFGLHVIASNVEAGSVVLEYPTFDRFKKELARGYDYVGIGSVVANFQKVRAMAEAVREVSPGSKIVIGGYCANIEEIEKMMPIDYLCTGEGISFMRELLGESPEFEFTNPDVYSRAHSFLGVPLLGRKVPHVIVGLGCSYGCEYCSPSHHFGRKYTRFYKSGEKLFREMERMEKKFRTTSFSFIGDDNFLLDLKRADELRELVVKHDKHYEIFYFVSPNKIMEFGAERMAEMGSNLVWIGRESSLVPHEKTKGIDLKAMIDDLHRHGIKVVASSMLLMDHHTPDNIEHDMAEHIALGPDFSMLTLYSPMPGTPLYERVKEEGRLCRGMPYEEWNGIWRQWVHNPHFTKEEGERVRLAACQREFHALGPSAMRLIAADLQGYLFMRESANPFLRKKAERIAGKASMYRALLWAMARLAPTDAMSEMIDGVRGGYEQAFGPTTLFEKTEGLGLWAFGTKEKIRHRLIGDVIQPPTTVTRYPG